MPWCLGLVGGWRYGTPVPSPISVHKFAGVTQQLIGMGTKVITLSLQWQNTKERTFRESVEVDNKYHWWQEKKKRNYVFDRQPWRHNNVNFPSAQNRIAVTQRKRQLLKSKVISLQRSIPASGTRQNFPLPCWNVDVFPFLASLDPK